MPKFLCSASLRLVAIASVIGSASAMPLQAVGASKPSPPKDTIVLENGDTVTGVLDREVAGTVYFKSDELGELTIPWAKIKTLRTRNGYVVLENTPGVRVHHFQAEAEHGTLAVDNGNVQVTPLPSDETASRAAHSIPASIPVKNAQFILDEATFVRQVNRNPNFFAGWNGSV
jgi:hypothetical protein